MVSASSVNLVIVGVIASIVMDWTKDQRLMDVKCAGFADDGRDCLDESVMFDANARVWDGREGAVKLREGQDCARCARTVCHMQKWEEQRCSRHTSVMSVLPNSNANGALLSSRWTICHMKSWRERCEHQTFKHTSDTFFWLLVALIR